MNTNTLRSDQRRMLRAKTDGELRSIVKAGTTRVNGIPVLDSSARTARRILLARTTVRP